MASSLLTQALLGGQLGGLGLGYGTSSKDPRVLAATARSRLGQAMLGQGLDASPAYPLQGLARLAQAIGGALIAKEGGAGLEDIAKQDATGAADAMAFMQGSPPATMVEPPVAPAPVTQPPIQGGGAAMASAPQETIDLINKHADAQSIPRELAYALFQQESQLGTDPKAYGNIGQITPRTAMDPGYGMTPMDNPEVNITNPDKNIGFSLEYLKRRGDAAGVDWKDPTQWAAALKGYNGGGDPNYVTNVSRFLPKGVQVAAAGNVATDASTGAPPPGAYETPEIKDALSRIQRAQEVLGNPKYQYNERAQAAAKAVIEKAKIDLQFGLHVADKQNAATVKEGDRRYQEQQKENDRRYQESQRPTNTIDLRDPDGKGTEVYRFELLPGGKVGKRIGLAPKQPGEGSPLGNSATALASNVLREHALAILNGTATPEQIELFRSAADMYTRQTINPQTGLAEQGLPLTPQMQAAIDALNKRGQVAPEAAVPAAAAPAAPPVPPVPGVPAAPAAPAVPAAPAAPAAPPQQAAQPPQPAVPTAQANPLAQPEARQTTPTGSVLTIRPPVTTPKALEDYRTAEVEANKVLNATREFMKELQVQGGTGFNSWIDNPRDPKAVRLNQLHNRLQEALRGEAFMNTGVLQPAEMQMLRERLLDPRSIRGWMATNDSYKAMSDVLEQTVKSGLDRRRELAGLPPTRQKEEPSGTPDPGAIEAEMRRRGLIK